VSYGSCLSQSRLELWFLSVMAKSILLLTWLIWLVLQAFYSFSLVHWTTAETNFNFFSDFSSRVFLHNLQYGG
jgi:hypothetical protein